MDQYISLVYDLRLYVKCVFCIQNSLNKTPCLILRTHCPHCLVSGDQSRWGDLADKAHGQHSEPKSKDPAMVKILDHPVGQHSEPQSDPQQCNRDIACNTMDPDNPCLANPLQHGSRGISDKAPEQDLQEENKHGHAPKQSVVRVEVLLAQSILVHIDGRKAQERENQGQNLDQTVDCPCKTFLGALFHWLQNQDG